MDPEEVRRFASELKRFNEDVQMKATSLQARFTALATTWQDQDHEKFAEEFITTMKVLRKFMETSEKHTPYLLRKAQRRATSCRAFRLYSRTSPATRSKSSIPGHSLKKTSVSTPSSLAKSSPLFAKSTNSRTRWLSILSG